MEIHPREEVLIISYPCPFQMFQDPGWSRMLQVRYMLYIYVCDIFITSYNTFYNIPHHNGLASNWMMHFTMVGPSKASLHNLML